MDERGIVVGKGGHRASVRIERSESCEGCHGCLMAETGKYMIAEAVDRIGVSPGDVVRLQTEGASPVKSSLLLFGVPLLMLFAGYAAGSGLASLLALARLAQGIGIGAAALFFIGSFGLLGILRKKISGGEDRTVIVEVLGHQQSMV